MAKATKLSSFEVAALVDGLKNLDNDGDANDASSQAKPYKFGEDNHSALGDYYGLRMVNERFNRLARSVFLPFLRMQPRISSFPPEVKSYDHYTDELDNFSSLTISRIDELRGTQMVVLQPSFVSLLTNVYYGGSIDQPPPSGRNEFTATELRVIELVVGGLNRALEMAWRDLFQINFTKPSHEENLQFASFLDGQDQVVKCSFIVQLPNADPADVDILYPLQTLKPIAAQLRSRTQSDVMGEDLSWRQRLERAVMEVPLTIEAHLDEPEVQLGQISGITAGKVVPVNLKPKPRLLIGGETFFMGELGEVSGKAAINITQQLPTGTDLAPKGAQT
ncbi:flagellar motor switch protein FliM [Donghicola tyrosinivorans]|uniref:Flagellar motor switch protein FliM n=1 Tax=Donghicola tyrosinivorans TaxID=1652492 RepID=A0A2T0WID2_9RHOB|nr:flagellar motor switch protein FliM [Donghicola tyrosinivorans]PRY86471.1 flagellar motor switch protein FliM [Donghicola tyrosinivorans]